LLILGYGNPSRGDDGLAPEFIDRLEQERMGATIPDNFDTLKEFQLQIENTLDLEKYPLVLLVDASIELTTAFELSRIHPCRDNSYSSHALSPATLLSVFQETSTMPMPAVYLLAIMGTSFELGDNLSASAEQGLQAAVTFTCDLLTQPHPTYWDERMAV